MITYNFKPTPEAVWFVVNAVGIVIFQMLATQTTIPDDPKAWFIALGGAALRTAIGAIISLIGKNTGGPRQ